MSAHTLALRIDIAVQVIKETFQASVAAGGGGRGGSSSANLNKATRSAQALACAFADYFGRLDDAFDADAFFRDACMTEAFIDRMSKARTLFEIRRIDQAWRAAKRATKMRQ